MTDIPKVEKINVILTRPTEYQSRTWCCGHYIIKDDVLTMTDKDGKPVVDLQGKTYSQRLDGENPRIIAACMTKKIRLELRGKSGKVAGFNRPLVYPKIGVA